MNMRRFLYNSGGESGGAAPAPGGENAPANPPANPAPAAAPAADPYAGLEPAERERVAGAAKLWDTLSPTERVHVIEMARIENARRRGEMEKPGAPKPGAPKQDEADVDEDRPLTLRELKKFKQEMAQEKDQEAATSRARQFMDVVESELQQYEETRDNPELAELVRDSMVGMQVRTRPTDAKKAVKDRLTALGVSLTKHREGFAKRKSDEMKRAGEGRGSSSSVPRETPTTEPGDLQSGKVGERARARFQELGAK